MKYGVRVWLLIYLLRWTRIVYCKTEYQSKTTSLAYIYASALALALATLSFSNPDTALSLPLLDKLVPDCSGINISLLALVF
jgi:hypothetical protein